MKNIKLQSSIFLTPNEFQDYKDTVEKGLEIIINRLTRMCVHHHGYIDKNTMLSFTQDYFRGTTWMCDNIKEFINPMYRPFNNVGVLGSGNSILLYELLDSQRDVDHWHFYDMNDEFHEQRNMYFEANNIEKNYTNYTLDHNAAFQDKHLHEHFDLIIVPSCECLPNMIVHSNNTMYALMSYNHNQTFADNCVSTSKELMINNGFKSGLFRGTQTTNAGSKFLVIA